MRKQPRDEVARWLRPLSGLLCLPVLYFGAKITLPYLEPLLSPAAVISAQLSFYPGETAAEAYEDSIPEIGSNVWEGAGDTSLLTSDEFSSDLETQPESSAPVSSEPASSSEAVSSQAPPQKPENAGTVRRTTYQEGTTSAYIRTGEGYIKNCTSHTPDEIAEVAAQQPSFQILANAEPEVLIMHTHATESYQPMQLDWYDKSYNSRTTDVNQNTCRVGDEIQKQLEAAGIGVIHDKTLHDYPSYNGAYERSAETVKSYLEKYPTIKVVLDVHRDAIQPDANTIVAPVTTIDGKSCAQVMIISGCDDGTMNMPNYMENLKLSAALQRTMAEDYPTLARPVLFDYRKYNQDLTTGSILLEMGGHANTLEEAIYCGELVGKSLAKTLLSLRG